MQRNTFLAILFSTLFLIVWWTYFQPPAERRPSQAAPAGAAPAAPQRDIRPEAVRPPGPEAPAAAEREITVDTERYKAVFTTRGAAVKHWYLKEKNGTLVDLVLSPGNPALSTFPGSSFGLVQQTPRKLVFAYSSPQGWQIRKTYDISEEYLHRLRVEMIKLKPVAVLPSLQIDWGPGLGTDAREEKENAGLTRALALTAAKPAELKVLKPGDHPFNGYRWAAIDNRYFLAAFIPENPDQFTAISVYRREKRSPPGIVLESSAPGETARNVAELSFYLGPKGHGHLKALNLDLEETVDFGFFGFLGKIALDVLQFLYRLTGNYGWAIIFLTVILQILVLPLTIKSLKASAAMKQLQPHIKTLQEKYKSDPRRLNVEMLNLYRTQKVNPLGGCLPMLLQIPIFWALFTTLRNAYELRGASWVLWVQDLSAPDTLLHLGPVALNVLPLVMGIGMFFQQKMMSVSTDPAQARIMYFMPVIFTVMFWGFPSGLVLYWLTNSVMAMLEQYIILRQQQSAQQGIPRP